MQHNASSQNIQRVQFDGEQRQTVASVGGSRAGAAFCIEFDQASRNLWIGNAAESRIEVLNVDNGQRAVVYAETRNETGVGRPLMLAVNEADNEVYWIDAGQDAVPKKIAAMRMDGLQTPRTLVQRDLNSPTCLAYHASARRLYWADAGRRKIESVSVDEPSDRVVVASDVESPSGLAIWDGAQQSADSATASILYYADRVQEQLVALNLRTSEKRVLKSNVPGILQLKIFQRSKSSE